MIKELDHCELGSVQVGGLSCPTAVDFPPSAEPCCTLIQGQQRVQLVVLTKEMVDKLLEIWAKWRKGNP